MSPFDWHELFSIRGFADGGQYPIRGCQRLSAFSSKVSRQMLPQNLVFLDLETTGANPRHGHEWKIWQDVTLPEGKILMPGVIGHATDLVEHEWVHPDGFDEGWWEPVEGGATISYTNLTIFPGHNDWWATEGGVTFGSEAAFSGSGEASDPVTMMNATGTDRGVIHLNDQDWDNDLAPWLKLSVPGGIPGGDYRATLTADRRRIALFNEECLRRGVVKAVNKIYVSLAHTEADVAETLQVFDAALAAVAARTT